MLITNPSTFTTWDTLAAMVAEHVNECPIFMLQGHAKRAARRFFNRSGIWRSPEAVLLTSEIGTQGYAHTPPTNGELVRIYSAWSGEDELAVELPGEAEDTAAATTETDATQLRIGVRDGQVWVSPVPGVTGVVVRGTAVYVPTAAGAGVPSHAIDEWGPEIAAGAAATLVQLSGKPWSQPDRIGLLQGEFNAAVSRASMQAGPVRRKPLRVTPW